MEAEDSGSLLVFHHVFSFLFWIHQLLFNFNNLSYSTFHLTSIILVNKTYFIIGQKKKIYHDFMTVIILKYSIKKYL
jgi:hypothetical protein